MDARSGFLEEEVTTAVDLVKDRSNKPLMTVRTEELVSHAIERMREYKISQIREDLQGFVGAIDETTLLHHFIADKNIADKPIKEIMEPLSHCFIGNFYRQSIKINYQRQPSSFGRFGNGNIISLRNTTLLV